MRRAWLALLAVVPLWSGCDRLARSTGTNTSAPQRLQAQGAIPGFKLIERNGRPVSLEDLHGKVWIASFFFTSSPGTSGTLNTRISSFRKKFQDDDRIRIISITSDPEHDKPFALTTYANRFAAGDKWYFLTGDKSEIRTLAHDGFKLPLAGDASGKGPVTHSTSLILVDQKGNIRGVYEGAGDSEEPIHDLLEDVQVLLNERVAAGK